MYTTQIEEIYSYYTPTAGVSIDSRKISTGTIFFGLPGEKVNGGIYAQQALKAGASLAIVDSEHACNIKDCIAVPNVTETLIELAKWHRKLLTCPIIGITGTNGKTTTKELLRTVLASQYKVTATEGNLNNAIGVPLTLLSIPRDCELAIVEMGANHPHEIATLCSIADPTHGLITSIGAAHLEGFGSLESIAQTKSELFAYLHTRDRLAFVRSDDTLILEKSTKLHLGCMASYYSLESYAVNLSTDTDGHLDLHFILNNHRYHCPTQLVGSYNAINVVAALHVGHYFNVPFEQGCKAIANYTPAIHRSQLVLGARNKLIVDCYNANPTSMQLAIESFMQIPYTGKRLLILGAMKELGFATQEAHSKLQQLVQHLNTSVWYIGSEWEKEDGALYFATTADCMRHIELTHYHNALILLKGSHSVGLERLLPLL